MRHDASATTETLRRRGHRMTAQRQMVLRALEESGHHLSAEEICQRIQAQYPTMSLSTVYRTLDLLVELGLVLEARLGSERRVYELAGEVGEHCHLICRACGAVGHPREMDLARLRAQLASETGYAALALDLVATGLCPRCAAAL
ncbi:MAG TPA: Fur family transcriptional regulator [Ktedonobacterales bacterium]|nr:Fur family transcriptional regulator [Ktedonobacterales bacterium]